MLAGYRIGRSNANIRKARHGPSSQTQSGTFGSALRSRVSTTEDKDVIDINPDLNIRSGKSWRRPRALVLNAAVNEASPGKHEFVLCVSSPRYSISR